MEERIRPARALAHPGWWAALVLLVLNDHLLKTAGVLPGWFTGKFSDFAGLFFAPFAIAALLRVASWRGLALVHVGVGLFFAAINVFPAAARGVEQLMAVTPFPWAITVDPTDLIALPMIALSWWALSPRMARPVALRPWLERATVGASALVCMATEPPDGNPGTRWVYPDWQTDLVVANDTGQTLVLRLRPLAPTVYVDCETVASSPSGTLAPQLFGEAVTWIVEPERTIPIRGTGASLVQAECHVYLLEGGGVGSSLLFWMDGKYQVTAIPSVLDDAYAGRTIRIRSIGGGVAAEAHPAVFGLSSADERRTDATCATPGPTPRVEWTEPLPVGDRRLVDVHTAPDGCHGLDLEGTGGTERWYLCLSGIELPFAVGEELSLVHLSLGQDFQSIEGVEIFGETRRLRVGRGADLVPFGAGRARIQVLPGCGWQHDACGNLVSPLEVTVEDRSGLAETRLVSGTSHVLEDGGGELHLLRAADLPVADAACLPFAEDHSRYIESAFVTPAERGGEE